MSTAAATLPRDVPARQLALRPREGWPVIEFGSPDMVRRACRPPAAPRPKARRARPTRWFEGMAPVVRLPLAGTDATRRYRLGKKPGSIGVGKLSEAEAYEYQLLAWELEREGVYDDLPINIPSDCPPAPEPCPWVRCPSHLYLDVMPPRAPGQPPIIKLNFPGLDVDEIPETCALRKATVAEEAGGTTLEEVGRVMNLTMGRVQQIEEKGVRKLAAVAEVQGWGEKFARELAKRKAKLPAKV